MKKLEFIITYDPEAQFFMIQHNYQTFEYQKLEDALTFVRMIALNTLIGECRNA